MGISMETIKKLREISGAGMLDCQKALKEASNDMDKAIEILRKSGIAKAAKREGREAYEGVIKIAVNDEKTEAYIVELNAETDFVVRSDKFQEFADKILELIKKKRPASRDELLALPADNGTARDSLDNLSGVIGEKLDIKRFAILKTEGTVGAYSHMGGKIGALVAIDKRGEDNLAYELAMQVAAANPKYLAPKDIPEDELNKEKEIYKEQLEKEGKPENIIDKIILGKLNKYYEEVALLKQEYIKDDKKRIEEILGEAKIEKFIRYSLD